MSRGNRPDCAYFLILGISLAAFLLTMGGIFTYVSFWPESALSHTNHHHQVSKSSHKIAESSSLTNLSLTNDVPEKTRQYLTPNENKGAEDIANYGAGQRLAFSILGPLCLCFGLIVLITVIVYALKFDCDHEPEPNIAFLRLKSDLSLNFDAERNKYELMVPLDRSTATGRRNEQNSAQRQRY